MNVIALATAWGPRWGGINCFNADLVRGLATYWSHRGRIMCCVPFADDDEIEAARTSGIHLLHINKPGRHKTFSPDWIDEILSDPETSSEFESPTLWVGHDVKSGDAAVRGGQSFPSAKSAVIMHMHYEAYKGPVSSPQEAQDLFKQQRRLFQQPDFALAVGPLLRNALHAMGRKDAAMLIPGFPVVKPETVKDGIHAIALGRFDAQNDLLKQISLAVAAVSCAVDEVMRASNDRIRNWNKKMKVFGVEDEAQTATLCKLADARCGSALNILPVRFDERREELLYELSHANIALLPSWHEGFGLAGWEAIAAETPLVLSRKTGLWKLLTDTFNDLAASGFVELVDIQGRYYEPDRNAGEEDGYNKDNFTPNDEEAVAKAVSRIIQNLDDRINISSSLKDLLQDQYGCTWAETAKQLLVAAKAAEPDADGVDQFVGEWTGFYVDGSKAYQPEIVREDITLSTSPSSTQLSGLAVSKVRGKSRTEEFSKIEFSRSVIAGTTKVEEWARRDGWARFQVALCADGAAMNGVVSWESTLKTVVAWSRYIWIRKGDRHDALCALAAAEMERELKLFSSRINNDAWFAVRDEKPRSA